MVVITYICYQVAAIGTPLERLLNGWATPTSFAIFSSVHSSNAAHRIVIFFNIDTRDIELAKDKKWL